MQNDRRCVLTMQNTHFSRVNALKSTIVNHRKQFKKNLHPVRDLINVSELIPYRKRGKSKYKLLYKLY